MLKAVKLLLFTLAGAFSGWLGSILLFADKNSTNRLVPTWGVFLSIVASLIGAVVAGKIYYELHCNNKEIDNK